MAETAGNDATYWRQFDQTHVTHSAAHYLMAVHSLHKEYGYARSTDVAEKLDVSRGAASMALAQLRKRGLIEEDAHRFLLLSEEGHRIVHEVERNFGVLASFFEEVLGASKDAAHADACKMEHLLSLETGRRLVRLMKLIVGDHAQAARLREALARGGRDHEERTSCPLCGGERPDAHE